MSAASSAGASRDLPGWLLTQTAAHAGRLVTERFAEIGARPDRADKRRNVVTITAAGRRRARELADRAAAIQEEMLAPLTTADRAELVRLLMLLRAGAAAE